MDFDWDVHGAKLQGLDHSIEESESAWTQADDCDDKERHGGRFAGGFDYGQIGDAQVKLTRLHHHCVGIGADCVSSCCHAFNLSAASAVNRSYSSAKKNLGWPFGG